MTAPTLPTDNYVDEVAEPQLAAALVRELCWVAGRELPIGDHQWRVDPGAYPDELLLVGVDTNGEPTGYVITASVSVSGWLTGPPTPPPPPRTSPVTVVYEGGHTVDVTPDTDWSMLRPDLPDRTSLAIVPDATTEQEDPR